MNRKLIIILSIVAIFVVAFFAIFTVDSINRTEDKMVILLQRLMNSISDEEYDKTKKYVKKADGTDLSEKELSNFLLNTGLYRAVFINDEKPMFTCSTNVSIFNTNKGTITFGYTALDGDVISNVLEYVNIGVDYYFVTTDVSECDKEVKRYPFYTDLKNGENFTYTSDDSESDSFYAYRFIKDEDEKFYLEIVEEAKEDLRITLFNSLEDTLKDKENEYRYEWNDDCSLVSVYYNSAQELSYMKNQSIIVSSIMCSVSIQALNDNPDWRLTINYYDYNTEELLKTKTVR